MRRRACTVCPHPEYLHNDRVSPTGECQVEGCHVHAFTVSDPRCTLDQLPLF